MKLAGLEAVGRPDLAALCARGLGPHQRPVVECLQAFFATRSRAEALAWLAEREVCFAPVNTLMEAMHDPNVAARGLLIADERGRKHLAPPIRFAREPAVPRLHEPLLGEHGAAVLAELGSEAGAW